MAGSGIDRATAQRDPEVARARPDGGSRAELGTTELAFLDLQATAGNRATASLVPSLAAAAPPLPPGGRSNGSRAAVQRVHIDSSGPETEENLLQPYDAKNKPTKMLTPHKYKQEMHFDLTRGTDKVAIEVKIKFVQPGGTEVPAGPKRDEVSELCRNLVGVWNGKFVLLSHTHPPAPPPGGPAPAGSGAPPTPGSATPPAPGAPAPPAPAPPAPAATSAPGPAAPVPAGSAGATAPSGGAAPAPVEVKLPIEFTATPVWDTTADETKMPKVVVHPSSERADATPGKRINSGNWFMNTGTYKGTSEEIYAHEYGHLIGIPDEYSQANPGAHAIMHKASVLDEVRSSKELDDATTKLMVLSALRPALQKQVQAISKSATAAIRGQVVSLSSSLGAALADAWTDPSLSDALTKAIQAQFAGPKQTKLKDAAAGAVSDAVGSLNSVPIARRAIATETSVDVIPLMLRTALLDSIQRHQKVHMPTASGGDLDVTIRTSKTVQESATKKGSPMAKAAADIATSSIGAPPVPRKPPPVTPTPTLLGQLQELAAQWGTGSDPLAGQVEALKATMSGNADFVFHPQGIKSVKGVQAEAKRAVAALTAIAASESFSKFLSDQVKPLFDGQVDRIVDLVQAEIDGHSTAAGTGTTASPAAPPDPRIVASVGTITTKMKELKDAKGAPIPDAKITGSTDAGPTPVNVSYTIGGLMGGGGTDVRTDYMQGIADLFNKDLKKPEEDPFVPGPNTGVAPGPSAPGGGGTPPPAPGSTP